MDILLTASLWLHIFSGFLALITGGVAIATKKGRKLHRTSGTIYFWCMATVAATALLLSYFKDIRFLLLIAIFSFYMSYTGYMIIRSKTYKPNIFDKLLLIAALITVIYMFLSLNVILMVFGLILSSFVVPDILRYLKVWEFSPKLRLVLHISRMIGAYIATCTAFLVVNIQFQPEWVVWLAPTIVGTPLISYFIRKYSRNKPSLEKV